MTDPHHRNGGALSPTERDGVQAMFDRLSGTYYDVLGVPKECDRAALREAYFQQVERFGPERYEGRDLGPYTMHVEAISREIDQAFAVLGDPDRRARYDRRLNLVADLLVVDAPARDARDSRTPMPMPARPDTRTPMPMHARDVHGAQPIGRDTRTPMPVMPRQGPERGAPVRSVTPTPSPPPAAPRPVTPPADGPGAARRGSYPPPAQRPASVPPPPMHRPSSPPPAMAAVPAGMALESLQRGRAETRSRDVQRTLDDLEPLIERAARNDDHAEIVKLLRHAVTLKPDDASWKARLARAEETFQDHEVLRLSNAARTAERMSRWEQAGDVWAKVADMRPNDAQVALHAAQALCEAGKDFSRAAEYARRSIRISPDVVAAHICLTRVFFKAGRTASARSALEQAAKLDPRNPEVVALGQKLRGA